MGRGRAIEGFSLGCDEKACPIRQACSLYSQAAYFIQGPTRFAIDPAMRFLVE
jgi:hypothetical protein